jgi:hypothetical protein
MTPLLALLVVFAAVYPAVHCEADGPAEGGFRFDPVCIAAQDVASAERDCCELHKADADSHDGHHYHFLFENINSTDRMRLSAASPSRSHSAIAVVDTACSPNSGIKLRRTEILSSLSIYSQLSAIPTGLSPPC